MTKYVTNELNTRIGSIASNNSKTLISINDKNGVRLDSNLTTAMQAGSLDILRQFSLRQQHIIDN
jgi:hypothetical protein